ncbi:MAG: hypothetical protein Q4Q17_04750 [Tissierellia bacterium]|nr:hypothetical protein [Tissierellia bacterium]
MLPNKDVQKNKDLARQRAEAMECWYTLFEEYNEKVEEAEKGLQRLDDVFRKLVHYYYGPWMKDREVLAGEEFYPSILGEDAFHESMEEYFRRLESLERAVKKIQKHNKRYVSNEEVL